MLAPAGKALTEVADMPEFEEFIFWANKVGSLLRLGRHTTVSYCARCMMPCEMPPLT